MPTRSRLLATVVTLAVLAAACGSSLSDADVLRANGVTTAGRASATRET